MNDGMIQNMPYRLADCVQVRKEAWGLLFYHQRRHKMLFVRSRDWLYPEHFDGTWTAETIIEDISRRTGKSAASVSASLPKLTERLTKNRMIVKEYHDVPPNPPSKRERANTAGDSQV